MLEFPDYGESASTVLDGRIRPRTCQAGISDEPTWLPDCSRKTCSPVDRSLLPHHGMRDWSVDMAKLTRGNRLHHRIVHPRIGQAVNSVAQPIHALPALLPLSRFTAELMKPARRASNASISSAASMLIAATTAQAVK